MVHFDTKGIPTRIISTVSRIGMEGEMEFLAISDSFSKQQPRNEHESSVYQGSQHTFAVSVV